jgi:hypothetical protein
MLKDRKMMPTPAEVSTELDELETMYKSRRKKLRALLAVLKDEEEGSAEKVPE